MRKTYHELDEKFHTWNEYRDRHFHFDRYHVTGYATIATVAAVNVGRFALFLHDVRS
jgi:hypothetical protein